MAELLKEEMDARGWTAADVAMEIWRHELPIKQLEIEMTIACAAEPGVLVNDDTCAQLDRAFGMSAGFFARIAHAPELPDVEPAGAPVRQEPR